MNNATRAQGAQHLKLIEDQGLDLKESDKLNLYLPPLAAGIKKGSIPPLETFRTVCEGRAKPESLKPRWERVGDTIFFTLPATDGTTGEGWINRLELQGVKLTDDARGVLRSNDFKPTTGVIYHVAVLVGATLVAENRITKNIQAEGTSRKWEDLPPEAVCLIREVFSDTDLEVMGLWWIVGFGKPIQFDGDPHFLFARRDDGGRRLGAGFAGPDGRWSGRGGFAFRVPQVQSLA